MRKSILLEAILCCIVLFTGLSRAYCFVHPENGSRLTQVQVMFEWDEVKGADFYELVIIEKGKDSPKSMRYVVKEISRLVSGLSFGKSYEWKVTAFWKHRPIGTSANYYFDILNAPQVMPDSFRAEAQNLGAVQSDIIFLDYSAMAIDRNGKPVWFLPVPADSLSRLVIRDLQLTGSGTITYLDMKGAYERSLEGKLLWKGPDDGRVSGESAEHYHHGLQKQYDGSFTVCGSVYELGGHVKMSDTNRIRYNTLIHYDSVGRVSWSWNELNSLRNDSVFNKNKLSGMAGHLNGFAFTRSGEQVFLSFKNYNDVCLLDIKSGKFLMSLKQNNGPSANLFHQQHGPTLTRNNELLLYNNNITDEKEEEDAVHFPSVQLYQFDGQKKSSRLAWSYQISSDRFPKGIRGKEGFVTETGSGNFLVTTGGANYTLEVSRKKKKTWECFFYRMFKGDSVWKPYSNYRCHWAASLYPLYFTVQFSGIRNGNASFRLYNAGTTEGEFQLEFMSASFKSPVIVKSGPLKPKAEQIFTIPGIKVTGDKLQCRVSPLHLAAPPKVYTFNNL